MDGNPTNGNENKLHINYCLSFPELQASTREQFQETRGRINPNLHGRGNSLPYQFESEARVRREIHGQIHL